MGYSLAQATAFIEYIAPIIVAEGTKRGYKVFSTTIAQAVIEGACATSGLAKNYHNHFGLKCGSSWKGASVNMKTKEEYTVGTLTTIKDNFRAYASDQEGIKGYYDFISTKRYENLKTATDYKQFAEFLKADGYATSSSYVQTLTKTVEKYSLQKYDSVVGTVPIHIQKRRTLRKGMSGSDVILVQQILLDQGYPVGKIDGIAGPKFDQSVRMFQSEKGLVVDGIVGSKTWMMLEKYN